MCVVVYPSLAVYSIGDPTIWLAKVTAVLGEKYQWLVKQVLGHRPLLAVSAEIWIGTCDAVLGCHRPALAVKKVNDFP